MLKGSWRCQKSDLSAHVLPKAIFNKELRKQCNFFCTLLISYWFETMYFQILLKELDASKVTKWQSDPDNIYRIWEFFEAFCFAILKLRLPGLLKWLQFYYIIYLFGLKFYMLIWYLVILDNMMFQFSELSLVDLVSNNYILYRESVCGLISHAKESKEIIL